jgi:hypothetical protein
MPRRVRHLPHGGEAVAACAVLVLLAHLVLAQLTFVLTVAFAVITRLSRWRLRWLTVPAGIGLFVTLAVGPAHAAAGFAAWPAHVLGYLGNGHLIDRLRHPLAVFAGAGNWLSWQFPIALTTGAAEAAVIGWLDRLRTDERTVPPPRPGAIAAIRGALAARMIAAGSVVTRDGCALGIVAATGTIAELPWSQIAGGALVVGASAREATVTSLQVVHAALRRRKPLLVIDSGSGSGSDAEAAIAHVIQAACLATGTRLRMTDIDLGMVVGERTAALIAAGSPERAVRACGDIAALAADLRRIGVDGDGLVWITGAERLPAPSIATLVHAAGGAGLAVLITTASPTAAMELAGHVAALLIHRIADPALAASLAARTGTRLRPGTPSADAPMVASGMGDAIPAAGLVPCPAVPVRTLLSLRPGEFVLAVNAPAGRPATFGRLVPARLPPAAAGTDGAADPPGSAAPGGPGPRGPGRHAWAAGSGGRP